MKKLLSLLLTLSILFTLCACTFSDVAVMQKNGKVTLSSTIHVEKAYATKDVLASFGKDAVITDVKIGDVDYKKITQTNNFNTTKEFAKSLYTNANDSEDSYSQPIFAYAKVNTKGFYAKTDKVFVDALKEQGVTEYSFWLTFPYEIKATNLKKGDDGKTVIFDNSTFSKSNIYAVTSACTEDWAKGNIYENVKALNKQATALGSFKVKTQIAKNNGVKVSWTKSKNADYYQVEYKIKGQKTYGGLETVFDGTSVKLSDLESGKTYKIKVSAYKGLFTETKKSVSTYVTVLKKNTLKATAKSKAVKLSWKKDKAASGYMLYMKKSGGKYKLVKTFKSAKTVKYTKTKLQSGKKYSFRIRSYKTVSGKKITGSYSKTKTVKVK